MVDEHFGISIVEYMAAGDSALHQILYLACEVQFWHFAIMCAFFSYTMCLQGQFLLHIIPLVPRWTSLWIRAVATSVRARRSM